MVVLVLVRALVGDAMDVRVLVMALVEALVVLVVQTLVTEVVINGKEIIPFSL